MQSKIYNNIHVLKIQKGDLIVESIKSYLKEHPIGFGKIEAIGMANDVKIGFLKETYYEWKTFDDVEITSLLGNISWDDEDHSKPLIHLHINVTDDKYNSYGGHFGEARVSGVVEMFITEISSEKVFKKNFGLVSFKTLDL